MDHDLLQKGGKSQVKARDAGSQDWKLAGPPNWHVIKQGRGRPQVRVPAPEVENTCTARVEAR